MLRRNRLVLAAATALIVSVSSCDGSGGPSAFDKESVSVVAADPVFVAELDGFRLHGDPSKAPGRSGGAFESPGNVSQRWELVDGSGADLRASVDVLAELMLADGWLEGSQSPTPSTRRLSKTFLTSDGDVLDGSAVVRIDDNSDELVLGVTVE